MADKSIDDLLDKFDRFAKKRKIESEFGNNLFSELKRIFIIPELEKRIKDGRIKESYFPKTMFIKITEKGSVIEFDEEIKLIAKAISAKNFDAIGESVELADIRGFLSANFEKEENIIQYFFIKKIYNKYHILFNSGTNTILDEDTNLTIAEYLGILSHLSLQEKVINWQETYSNHLSQIGLWAIPALIPYPINNILELLSKDNLQGARSFLLEYCSPEFIEKLSDKWWSIKQFNERKKYFIEILDAHKKGKYRLVIPALSPQIEGIMSDWLFEKEDGNLKAYRQESKTKRFFDIVNKNIDEESFKIIINSVKKFILEGIFLKTFKTWNTNIENVFPNRHIVEHGKYDDSIYSEENAIKLFLLLDTIFYIIKKQFDKES